MEEVDAADVMLMSAWFDGNYEGEAERTAERRKDNRVRQLADAIASCWGVTLRWAEAGDGGKKQSEEMIRNRLKAWAVRMGGKVIKKKKEQHGQGEIQSDGRASGPKVHSR